MDDKNKATVEASPEIATGGAPLEPLIRAVGHPRVSLERAHRPPTEDEILWMVIRNSTNNLSFKNYSRFLDAVLCGDDHPRGRGGHERRDFELKLRGNHPTLPFTAIDPYSLLKAATHAFLMVYCGVDKICATQGRRELADHGTGAAPCLQIDLDEERARLGHDPLATHPPTASLEQLWENYLQDINGSNNLRTLPYLELILQKLPGVPVMSPPSPTAINCYSILKDKLVRPCFVELIWSYWQEEGMLVQTMNAILQRFQNQRGDRERDPLSQLEIDPLRPLNSLVWNYSQDLIG